MNALAGDQADRIGELLEDERLRDVTAGLYIGEASSTKNGSPYGRVAVDRAEIRRNPPDILITNYKMLDLLLQRQQDAPLWADADLAYIVIDEFHTYDGAQGTDVAMLLRRLGVVVGAAEEGRPLGSICPVATSATLGESPVRDRQDQGGAGGSRAMLNVASQVFGVRFPDDAVVGEDRRDLNSFLSPVDVWLPLPSPAQVAALPDPPARDGGLDEVSRLVLGCDTSHAREMGRRLLAHPLTHDLLTADVDQPLTAGEILAAFPASSAWRVTAAQDPEIAAKALARFIALISVARDPGAPAGKDRPLLLVETHLWVRALSRVLRFVAPQPAFSWTDADRAAFASVTSAAQADRNRAAPRAGRLPSAYCRHCGRSGWSAVCPERNPTSLVSAPDDVYRLSVGGGAGKARVRALIAATPAEAANQARQALGRSMRRGKRAAVREATVLVLEDNGEALRRIDPDEVLRPDGSIAEAPENGVFVKAWFDNADQDAYAKQDRCPACGQAQGIRFLGAGVAPLASVAVTQLFTGGELPKKDADGNDARKTLIFNDSVQDAAHRAGFVASRAWKFSLRSLVQEQLAQRSAEEPDFADEGVPLNELIAALVKRASVDKEKLLASVVPPDLHDVDKVKRLLAGKKRLPKGTWELVGERLAFNTLLEFGLNSRAGRTLELTRTVAAEVYLPDPTTAAKLAEGLYREHLRRRAARGPRGSGGGRRTRRGIRSSGPARFRAGTAAPLRGVRPRTPGTRADQRRHPAQVAGRVHQRRGAQPLPRLGRTPRRDAGLRLELGRARLRPGGVAIGPYGLRAGRHQGELVRRLRRTLPGHGPGPRRRLPRRAAAAAGRPGDRRPGPPAYRPGGGGPGKPGPRDLRAHPRAHPGAAADRRADGARGAGLSGVRLDADRAAGAGAGVAGPALPAQGL